MKCSTSCSVETLDVVEKTVCGQEQEQEQAVRVKLLQLHARFTLRLNIRLVCLHTSPHSHTFAAR